MGKIVHTSRISIVREKGPPASRGSKVSGARVLRGSRGDKEFLQGRAREGARGHARPHRGRDLGLNDGDTGHGAGRQKGSDLRRSLPGGRGRGHRGRGRGAADHADPCAVHIEGARGENGGRPRGDGDVSYPVPGGDERARCIAIEDTLDVSELAE